MPKAENQPPQEDEKKNQQREAALPPADLARALDMPELTLSANLDALRKSYESSLDSLRWTSLDSTLKMLANLSDTYPSKLLDAVRSIDLDSLNRQWSAFADLNLSSQSLIDSISSIGLLQKHPPSKDVVEKLKKQLKDYETKEKNSHLLSRVHPVAKAKLSEDPAFRNVFDEGEQRDVTIMSLDIRRSTELMLKANTPNDYAVFVRTLCAQLSQIIIDEYGIYDKFTGDGVLAMFPSFYSGEDSVLHAVAAAIKCHRCFQTHYDASRSLFSLIIRSTGLGIGIDTGLVQITTLNNDYTAVGRPVVYACRLSSVSLPGETLLNQGTINVIKQKYSDRVAFSEKDVEVKGEGIIGCYSLISRTIEGNMANPSWIA